jgi:hypothetical protein
MYARAHRFAVCTGAIAAISLTGCSASVSVGEQQHLNNPDTGIAGLLHPTPKSVKCPTNIAAKAGVTFTCNVVAADGSEATVSVIEYKKGYVRLTAIDGKPTRRRSTATAKQ